MLLKCSKNNFNNLAKIYVLWTEKYRQKLYSLQNKGDKHQVAQNYERYIKLHMQPIERSHWKFIAHFITITMVTTIL